MPDVHHSLVLMDGEEFDKRGRSTSPSLVYRPSHQDICGGNKRVEASRENTRSVES